MKLNFNNLKHIYPSPAAEPRPVLDIPSWTLDDEQQVLLRGVSGSGKTTLFNIAAGLMHPTEGEVRYGDQPIYALSESARDRFRAQNIGYVFQNHYLLPTLTALENVMMPLAFGGEAPRSQWKTRAADMLSRLGLLDHHHYRPAKMSTGQRMRVAIARALVSNPAVLLADEPTASLDSDAAETVMDEIQQICRENGAILVVASHDPALDKRFNTVVHLADQKIRIEEKTPA